MYCMRSSILDKNKLKAYLDYRARLAYVMTFDHPHAHNSHLRYPHVSYECRVSNLHDTICREVMTYVSRAR